MNIFNKIAKLLGIKVDKPSKKERKELNKFKKPHKKRGNPIKALYKAIIGEDTFKAIFSKKEPEDFYEQGKLTEESLEYVKKKKEENEKLKKISKTIKPSKNDVYKAIGKATGYTTDNVNQLLNKLRGRAFEGMSYESRDAMFRSYKVIESIIKQAQIKYKDKELFSMIINWRANYLDELLRLVAAIYDDGGYNTSYDKGDPEIGRQRYEATIDNLAEVLGVNSPGRIEFL